jgi:Acetyltransferase (GNAT) domain
MADRRHHGEGEHHHRYVAMPAMPGSALVVIEPELVFGGLKTVLDRPAMAFDRDQRFDGCACWAPGGEEGEVIICDTTTDQQTACPQTVICVVELAGIEIGQFEIAPIMQPRSFGSVPCRQAFPVGWTPRRCDVRGGARNGPPLTPGMEYMSAADPEHIAFACLAELLFDIPDTVDRIGSHPLEWHSRGYRACDHSRRKLWFGRKARVGRHVCGFQTIWIVGPFLWKIQRAIDERMAMTRNVGSEDADLAVRNLACRTGVLPRHAARRLALLEKASLVDHEDRIVICQMLDDIVAHDIAQGIRIPIPATKDRLLPPWTRIASRLRAHPAGLALLIAEQTFQKQACVPRNPLLPEQWTYPLLNLPKRRSPQRKRLFNRRCPRPRSSNHGCPWIQKSSERATVMLGWRLVRNAWGHGYATESAKAALRHAVHKVGLSEILSYTSPDNERSQAVMVKLNFVREPARDFMMPSPSAERWQGLIWVVPSRLYCRQPVDVADASKGHVRSDGGLRTVLTAVDMRQADCEPRQPPSLRAFRGRITLTLRAPLGQVRVSGRAERSKHTS